MEFSSNKPIYKQIVDYCTGQILSGQWTPGERAPSARDLAVTLAVNLHTILKAYDTLEADGIIYNRRGMGFFVADNAVDLAADTSRSEFFSIVLPSLFDEMERLGITPDDLTEAWNNRKK